MIIRNNRRALLVFDLPSNPLHLPGLSQSRELTDAEMANPDIQKALSLKWIRVVKPKVMQPSRTLTTVIRAPGLGAAPVDDEDR